MGTLGNVYNYSAAFAEAEERSPWQPFHVQHGYKATDSTVSIFFGGRYTTSGFGPRETWKEKFVRCLTAGDHNSAPLIVMDPLVARLFVELGFDTKEKFAQWCSENAVMTAREYWDDQWVQTLTVPLAVAGVETARIEAQGAAGSTRPVVRAGGNQHRGRRRRNPGRVPHDRRTLRQEQHDFDRRLAMKKMAQLPPEKSEGMLSAIDRHDGTGHA